MKKIQIWKNSIFSTFLVNRCFYNLERPFCSIWNILTHFFQKFLTKNENFSTFLNGWFKIPKIFPAYFSVRETLVLLFDNVVFFSDDKNVILQ